MSVQYGKGMDRGRAVILASANQVLPYANCAFLFFLILLWLIITEFLFTKNMAVLKKSKLYTPLIFYVVSHQIPIRSFHTETNLRLLIPSEIKGKTIRKLFIWP